jgi:2-phosphoglycerate kinase
MIYLLGGAPRVGKSIAAKRLAEKVGAKLIKADDVASDYAGSLPEGERMEKFPFPGFSGEPSENDRAPGEMTRLQLVDAKSLEPELERLIARAQSAGEALVLEGVQLLPEFVRQIADKLGQDTVRSLFIGSTDAARVREGISKNTSPDDWMRDSDTEVIKQVADFAVDISGWLKQASADQGLPYFERTDDFAGDVERVIKILEK